MALVVEPDIRGFPPPVPALIHLEPGATPQPRAEAKAKPKPRKRPSVKLGLDRIKKQNKRARPEPKVGISKSNNMKEVNKRRRSLSEEQRNRTAAVRKVGACKPCHNAHRAVGAIPSNFANSLMDQQCTHVTEEPISPGTNDPMTPNGDVSMDIPVYSPLGMGCDTKRLIPDEEARPSTLSTLTDFCHIS